MGKDTSIPEAAIFQQNIQKAGFTGSGKAALPKFWKRMHQKLRYIDQKGRKTIKKEKF